MSQREVYAVVVCYLMRQIAHTTMVHTVAGSPEQAAVQVAAAYSGFDEFSIEWIGTREEWAEGRG